MERVHTVFSFMIVFDWGRPGVNPILSSLLAVLWNSLTIGLKEWIDAGMDHAMDYSGSLQKEVAVLRFLENNRMYSAHILNADQLAWKSGFPSTTSSAKAGGTKTPTPPSPSVEPKTMNYHFSKPIKPSAI
ncbi:hypothetical protein Moror_2082 [Moniliophthora roreri MCA 2997]|uniref:Uncharacterized protein n=1 Tax=Moniliophthora roreri (strain MCA 2997) TaxID=1381753 RepID=V2WT80_MONRO|nr:hypothetical protein Moror_2082 [Moniliophthora roreri MCA 2997]